MPTVRTTPMVPVDALCRAEDGTDFLLSVHGEPTASESLFIIPEIRDGKFLDRYSIVHAPTGLRVCSGTPDQLREIANRVKHLDWANTTRDNFRGSDMAKETAVVIQQMQFTDPTAVELPAHDAWGPEGKGKGLHRAALPLAGDFLSDLQHSITKTFGDDSVPFEVPDPENPGEKKCNVEWSYWIMRKVHTYGLAYLLLALHQIDPRVADSAAAFLADCWETGDSVDEFAWQWHQALLKGEALELPGIPRLGELFTDEPAR